MVEANCLGCHAGDAPFDFITADGLAEVAPLARAHVRAGTMPPWPPEGGVALRGDRRLDDDEVHLLAAWLADPVLGDAVLTPPPRDEVRRDATIEVPAFQAPTGEGHRCFVVDLPDGQLEAYAVQREGPVHHVLLGRFAEAAPLLALDAADPEPGWACPDAFMPGAEPSPEQVPILWFPGSNPTRTFPGTALALGGVGVVQVHTAGAGTASVVLELDLAEQALTERTLSLGVGRIVPEEQPEVRRTAFVRDWMRPEDLAIAKGQVWLTGARGHGHDRLRQLTLRSEDRVWLDLVRWEVAWQSRYVFAEAQPIDLDAPLTLECRYGSSTGSYPSEQEMCGGWLFFTVEAPLDPG